MLNGWKTVVGTVLVAFAVYASATWPDLKALWDAVLAAGIGLGGIGVAHKLDKLKTGKTVAPLLLAGFALAGCAAPASEQGQGQGESRMPVLVFAPTFTFGAVTGGAQTSTTTAPTVANAKSDTAGAEQRADAKVDAKLDATIPAGAAGAAIPVIGGGVAVPEVPVVVPPVEDEE